METELNSPYASGETHAAETETYPEVIAAFKRHIVDREILSTGRQDLVRSMGDVAVGARQADIDRTDPPLQIESATLVRGKSRVLIGPNGAGKSTVFDAFMERDNAAISTKSGHGAVTVGRSIHGRDRHRIARLDQEELVQGIRDRTAAEVLESAAIFFKSQLPIHWNNPDAYDANLKNQEAHARIEALMDKIATLFEMKEFLGRRVKDLSGGERTKLALFMVLASEADSLLLDEPTNHLDLKSISKLTALFNEYKRAGISIVSVSHVDWFLREAGNDGVWEIQWNRQGRKLVESTSPYAKYIKDTSRERVPIISGNVEWPQREYGYKQGEVIVSGPPTFTVENSPLMGVAFPNIHGGELIMVSGNNGTGKSMLMEAVVRNTDADKPKKQKGVHIAHLPQFWPEEISRGNIGDFFEWVQRSIDPYAQGSSLHPEGSARNLFVKLVGQLSFGGKSHFGESWLKRPLQRLSGGEQRLLWFIAVSSVRNVDMLALDEPTNHMDRDAQERVAEAVRTFPGATMLSTHDRNLIEALSKNSGTVRGAARLPTHVVLEKKDGKTHIGTSAESPRDYMEKIAQQARRSAKHLI